MDVLNQLERRNLWGSASIVLNLDGQAVPEFWSILLSRLLQTKDDSMQLMLNQPELMANFYNNSLRGREQKRCWKELRTRTRSTTTFLFTSTHIGITSRTLVRCKQWLVQFLCLSTVPLYIRSVITLRKQKKKYGHDSVCKSIQISFQAIA